MIGPGGWQVCPFTFAVCARRTGVVVEFMLFPDLGPLVLGSLCPEVPHGRTGQLYHQSRLAQA